MSMKTITVYTNLKIIKSQRSDTGNVLSLKFDNRQIHSDIKT